MSLEGVTGSPFPLPTAGAKLAGDLPFADRGGEAAGDRFFSSLVPIGQVLGTYLVCEDADGIVLVDQHAADERIVFSRLKDRYLGKRAPTQQWLDAVEVALPGWRRSSPGPASPSSRRRGSGSA
jgi:DNA mismatch repair protein MutL